MSCRDVGDDGVDEKFLVPFMFKLVCDGVASSPGVRRAMACAKNLWWVACSLLQDVSIQKENDEDGSLRDASRRTWD